MVPRRAWLKSVTLLTRGAKWPLRCLDFMPSQVQTGPSLIKKSVISGSHQIIWKSKEIQHESGWPVHHQSDWRFLQRAKHNLLEQSYFYILIVFIVSDWAERRFAEQADRKLNCWWQLPTELLPIPLPGAWIFYFIAIIVIIAIITIIAIIDIININPPLIASGLMKVFHNWAEIRKLKYVS